MLDTLIKGCYLCGYKYRRRNLNVYPNKKIILVKAAVILEGIRRSSLIIKKNNQTKQERYFDETNKKSGSYCKELMNWELN